MHLEEQIIAISLQCGFTHSAYISTQKLKFYPEVRAICEGNTCRNYGATWACPPAVGTVEECKARISQYERMLLLSKKYELEDSFDFEGMMDGMRDFKDTVDRFECHIHPFLPNYLLLANEGCGRCRKCTYPDAPCHFPDQLHPSLEGYGFLVSELATDAGIPYNNGPNTVTFFGALVF